MRQKTAVPFGTIPAGPRNTAPSRQLAPPGERGSLPSENILWDKKAWIFDDASWSERPPLFHGPAARRQSTPEKKRHVEPPADLFRHRRSSGSAPRTGKNVSAPDRLPRVSLPCPKTRSSPVSPVRRTGGPPLGSVPRTALIPADTWPPRSVPRRFRQALFPFTTALIRRTMRPCPSRRRSSRP